MSNFSNGIVPPRSYIYNSKILKLMHMALVWPIIIIIEYNIYPSCRGPVPLSHQPAFVTCGRIIDSVDCLYRERERSIYTFGPYTRRTSLPLLLAVIRAAPQVRPKSRASPQSHFASRPTTAPQARTPSRRWSLAPIHLNRNISLLIYSHLTTTTTTTTLPLNSARGVDQVRAVSGDRRAL